MLEEGIQEIVQGGLTLENTFMLFQILIVLYLALYAKAWLEKLLAWHKFKKSNYLGINRKVTVDAADPFTGHITYADRNVVVIDNGKEMCPMDVRTFMDEIVVVEKAGFD